LSQKAYIIAVQNESGHGILIMKPSSIIFPNAKELPHTQPAKRLLARSYLFAREQQQFIDIELQRSKILVLDSAGNVIKLKLQQEH